MSNVTHEDPVVTESKLTEFYEDIKPFLGCPAYITQEGDSEYYSTDEKVIGRWTDGKPLYQKTIKNTSLTVIEKSAWTTYANVSSLHIDSLVGTSFGRLTSGGNKEDDMSDVCFWTDGTNLQANSRGEGTNTPNGSVVTIKYTKTTDSAVTTVDQDPNKYSTEEKIIGEWIDGKPIYQKTYTLTSGISKNGWNAVPHGVVGGIDTLIKGFGTFLINTGTNKWWNSEGNYSTLSCVVDADIKNGGNTEIGITSSYNVEKAVWTLQYTKNTD